MANDLPPVPQQAPMTDSSGNPTPIWSEWLRKLTGSSDKSASGYQKLPGGVIFQWGVTGSLSSATTTAVDFPIDFPTGCLQVISGVRDNSAVDTTATGQWGTGNYSVGGFDLYNRTSGARTFNWIAIGY
jgi:hypothetical protein